MPKLYMQRRPIGEHLSEIRRDGRLESMEWWVWQDALAEAIKANATRLVPPEQLKTVADNALIAWRQGFEEREKRPTVVCLVGSCRFYEAFRRAEYEEEKAGHIVLSIGFKPDVGPNEHGHNVGVTPEEKARIDALYLAKIDLAHEIFVQNVGGYVGETTQKEIEYAREHGKRIRYLEETKG